MHHCTIAPLFKFYLLAIIVFSFASCQKENLTVTDAFATKNEGVEKRLTEINDFIDLIKSDGVETRSSKKQEWTPQEFESLTEDAINVTYSHNLSHFSEFYTKFDTLTLRLSGCKITEKDAKKLFHDILKASQEVYKAKSANLKRLVLVSIDVVKTDCNQIQLSVMTKIGLKYKELQVQSRNVGPNMRQFIFPEGTSLERHAGEPEPFQTFNPSIDCNTLQPAWTADQIAHKAYDNYTWSLVLPSPGTFINQTTKICGSATPNNCGYCPIEGMWYGPRYNVSGCADWEELNGYVDVGFDFLVSEGNQLGKYCTFIMGHEITETCNFQNMLDVWGFHTKWSNWVPNFPPCCYE